jgi:hypothetical protein
VKALFLFLDGVGIGRRDPRVNPLFAARLPAMRSLFHGELPSLHARRMSSRVATVIPLDPNLGVAGLPQSGTGQTALFTGINAPKYVGKHFGPYPYSTLKPVLEEQNIFRRLLAAGRTVAFANAFPDRFFEYARLPRARLTVTTLCCRYAGVPIRTHVDLAAGTAISADITNAAWAQLGHPHIGPVESAEAGRRLARLTLEHDFVLFEYWRTDHAGHSQNMREAVDVLENFDGFLVGIMEGLDTRDTLLLITSDHGNIEDISTKSHTRNPVPLILYGARHAEHARALDATGSPDLTHITPFILRLLRAD